MESASNSVAFFQYVCAGEQRERIFALKASQFFAAGIERDQAQGSVGIMNTKTVQKCDRQIEDPIIREEVDLRYSHKRQDTIAECIVICQ